ncbi:hypothetical protein DLM20_25655, partial [Salmonella enterica subsp. enterica serovar Java]|nr:hypothetical protein [Salmonella enterica subsp. enterica serovar Java]
MLCREIAARLAPDANFVEQIAAVQRKLSRVSPSTSQSRVRAIYYGEAKRIDHFEMDALNNVRTRVLRLDDAIKMLEYAPIMA